MPSLNRPTHMAYLARVTRVASERGHLLTEWERQFCKDMRRNAMNRKDVEDISGEPWDPSVKQWNQLKMIGDKLGA